MSDKKVPKRITASLLRTMGACPDGVVAFRKLFGRGADFVPGNVYRAFDGGNVARWYLHWLLAEISPEDSRSVVSGCRAARGRCICDHLAAVKLIRLARQNLPRKAGAK